jgi:hypothetical protein
MATGLVFAIVLIALAIILFGQLLLESRRIEMARESSASPGAVTFKDCYDLHTNETQRSSVAFTTVCTRSGRV